MSNQDDGPAPYPLLAALAADKGLRLKQIYKVKEVAALFEVSDRTIHDWKRNRRLTSRNLPGRGKFLAIDLERFLDGSIDNRPSSEPVKNSTKVGS